jgi:hypothetical protein
MLRASKTRQAVRLLGAAAVAGALSAGLLVTPVSAGAVNGIKNSSYSTKSAAVNGVGYQSKGDAVNGVKVNGVGVNGVGAGRHFWTKDDVNGVRTVNGV